MLNLNIDADIVYFRNIKHEQLPIILQWYNKVDDFKFATGIDRPIELEELTRKYAEAAICSDEFFVGIYTKKEQSMIGILKGRIRYKGSTTAWISSIVIDTIYQGNGFGRISIELLLGYLRRYKGITSVYLAVIEENFQGRKFWDKQDFITIRKIENHIKLQDKNQNVIIMHKSLY